MLIAKLSTVLLGKRIYPTKRFIFPHINLNSSTADSSMDN